VLQRPVEFGQYTSWAFTSRVHEAGLIASMGSVGDYYDCQSVSAGTIFVPAAPAVTV
jgi:hypothetical protein